MPARRYRLGRAAVWLLSVLGWLLLAGGLVLIGLGVFQMIVLGTRDLWLLAPYLGGGFAVAMNGLFMVAGAQGMLALFDIALSGRALVLNVPSQPGSAAAGRAQPVPAPPEPARDPRGRAQPMLRRPAQPPEPEEP
ncbi:hypothetical protein [Mangrovicoccus algicola]|uniref:Uncharacterized protein n=1 Tax=Mangrovicoccus algicola TaxID=2771008 RepID=A0A8J7CIY4_9RHOB|nr:hypothetical protein [Mangrovicoccus algicola]MBE3637051.1 hypothetical protein [Mangrovicoccus algicola]